jgi:hypothetical protein
MKVEIKRFADNNDTTMGMLFIDGRFKCFTIEDEERDLKVSGETRIPNGTYNLGLRREGGFHNRYSKKFPENHKGMICVYNKDNWKIEANGMEFQYVLFHVGNTDEDTMGCLLLNDGLDGRNYVGNGSVNAYKRVYPIIANMLYDGNPVTIKYSTV